jgi:putative Mg2+ transporter-C (MgtC) family protein
MAAGGCFGNEENSEELMPTTLTWQGVVLRLLLTFVCAGLLGLNRDESGRPAGLRTTLLVGLAACLSMIQANWLINSNGKAADSFVVMDVMRLPLGILSGIGFIGAGTILKRGELAVGVTTAATIWFVTVMGLCFGGGQIGLGLAGFVLGLIVLAGLKRVERQIPRVHSATLRITVAPGGLTQAEAGAQLTRAGISLAESFLSWESLPAESKVFGWKVNWKGPRHDHQPPSAVEELAAHPDVRKLEFTR